MAGKLHAFTWATVRLSTRNLLKLINSLSKARDQTQIFRSVSGARTGRTIPGEGMADTVLEQILVELRKSTAGYYPRQGELRALRVVGHTPKTDHMIYDVCADLANGSERMAIKIYRPGKCANPRGVARQESANLQYAHQTLLKRKQDGVPRPLGDYSEMGAVVTAKVSGLPLQSIIMKAALLPGFADNGSIGLVARRAGEWLRVFHKATAD